MTENKGPVARKWYSDYTDNTWIDKAPLRYRDNDPMAYRLMGWMQNHEWTVWMGIIFVLLVVMPLVERY